MDLSSLLEGKKIVSKETIKVKETTDLPLTENTTEDKKVFVSNNSDKLKLLQQETKPLDLVSINEGMHKNDASVIRVKGSKKRTTPDDFKITLVTKDQFLDYKTFIPNAGNIAGNTTNLQTSVRLTKDNEQFIKDLIYKHGVRKNAVVNHILDIIRTYHKDKF